jgi:hypothetical protein
VEICGWEARIGVGWLEVRFGGADILPLPPTELGIMPGSPPPLERRARRRRLGGETCSWLAAAGVCGAVGRAETGVRPPGRRRVGWGREAWDAAGVGGHAASGGIASFVPLLPLDLSRRHVRWQFDSFGLPCLLGRYGCTHV